MAKKEAASLTLKPLDDRVVVEPLEAEDKTSGGILRRTRPSRSRSRGR